MGFVFFSLATLPDAGPEEHREYNKWHQLDHRPENLNLPGVEYGDRWGRPAEFKAAGTGNDTLGDTDYVTMYWYHEPFDESYRQWNDLGETSFQWGRGPLIPGVERRMLAFFRIVKGYAAASSLVSPEVLKYRPNQGIHFLLTRHQKHHSLDTHTHYTWTDRVLMPGLMEVDGVAGGYTFSFSHFQKHSTMNFNTPDEDAASSMRVRLLYLDGDPLATTERIAAAEEQLARNADCGDAGEVLLSTPVKTIIPFQDW
ncbi:hypothetical protein [Enemella sp. A6]|uniref:hypothetical protein n=1 Tax=Enemella sp. A6 TaxID=3440152 RepID=UPI003EBB7176